MDTAEKIIQTCEANYDSTKGDCVDFAASVLKFYFKAPDFDGNVLADEVVARLKTARRGWTSTRSIATAIARAKMGDFVIAGMAGKDLGEAHGHLAVVVGVDNASSSGVVVPTAYAGSIGAAAIRRAPLSKTFNAQKVRTEGIDYYYKTPDTEPAASPFALRELFDRRPRAFRLASAAPLAAVPTMAWGKHVSDAFKTKIHDISAALSIEADHLMACVAFETGESFDPAEVNPVSGPTGLIQFKPATAAALGTTTAKLAVMSAENQLDYVNRYFSPYAGRLANLGDVYMAILWPKAIGKPDDYVLFAAPSVAYQQHKGLDLNKDDKVTRHEAYARVEAKLAKGMKIENYG